MKSAQNNFCEFTSENPRVFYQPYPASGYGRLRRHARPAGAFFCCLIALGWLVDLGLSDTLGYPVGYSKSYDFSWFHDVSIEHHWTRPYWKYTPFSDTAIWVHYLGLTGGLTLKTYSNQKLRNAVTSHKRCQLEAMVAFKERKAGHSVFCDGTSLQRQQWRALMRCLGVIASKNCGKLGVIWIPRVLKLLHVSWSPYPRLDWCLTVLQCTCSSVALE